LTAHVPDLLTERRLYPPSIALSNDLMVSRGLSQRGRVGFERSGSAAEESQRLWSGTRRQRRRLTDYITITIFMLDVTERLEGRLLQDGGIFVGVSGSYGDANGKVGHVENVGRVEIR
jgi:hypothetical protein